MQIMNHRLTPSQDKALEFIPSDTSLRAFGEIAALIEQFELQFTCSSDEKMSSSHEAAGTARCGELATNNCPGIDSEDQNSVITEFLFQTLIEQRRLKNRGIISYHGLYRWREPIKRWQIAALKR